MTDYKDIKGLSLENIVDTGTEGTKVAVGTTGERGTTAGQFRYNSTTGKFEGRDGSSFVSLTASPTITSIDDTEVDSGAGGNQTIVITGTNFATGDVASFIGSSANFNAATTTIDSATQITAVAPKASFLNAQEPYGVRVTGANGLIATLASQINVDNAPTWTTASGSLGSVASDATGDHFTLAASDADGDTIAYTETGATNITGAGLTLNSSTGVIAGDPDDVGSNTTVSFTGRATANTKTADRSFSFIVTAPFSATGGTERDYGSYRSHTFLADGSFVVSGSTGSVDMLILSGGGSGGRNHGGGGGAGGMRIITSESLAAGTYAVVVGAGGVGLSVSGPGNDGGVSSLGSYASVGGGGGGGYPTAANAGGSGGGGYNGGSGASGTAGQGNDGGAGSAPNGGGGGGAGANGSDAGANGGAGGAGSDNDYSTGSNITYAGGGGGNGRSTTGGAGGSGGGGAGGDGGGGAGGDGDDNTGGGGGGSHDESSCTSGDGGSGIVVIRYIL